MVNSIGESRAAPKGGRSQPFNVPPQDICGARVDHAVVNYEFDAVHRQAAIENALQMALHYLRQPAERLDIEAKNLRAAVARVNRAMALMAVAQAELTCAERL